MKSHAGNKRWQVFPSFPSELQTGSCPARFTKFPSPNQRKETISLSFSFPSPFSCLFSVTFLQLQPSGKPKFGTKKRFLFFLGAGIAPSSPSPGAAGGALDGRRGEMAPTSDSDSAGPGVMYSDNLKGFLLALLSSAFIGASFIIKKKGLKRAGSSGARAGIHLSPRVPQFFLLLFLLALFFVFSYSCSCLSYY